MYLLSSAKLTAEAVPPIDEDLRTAMLARGGPTAEPQDRELLEEIRAIDPSYDPEVRLSASTVNVLREIFGDSTTYYYSLRSRSELLESLRIDVARAMVLSELSFGYFDQIAANLTSTVLHSFSRNVLRELTIDGEQVPLEMLGEYLGTDGSIPPFGFEGNRVLKISYPDGKDGLGNVLLELKMEPSGNRLQWCPRGRSKFRKTHLALIEELNSVLEDLSRRIGWMRSYREAKRRPALDAEVQKQVFYALFYICKDPNDLSALRPGIFFGDDSLKLRNGNGRLIFERCLECSHPVSLTFVLSEAAPKTFRDDCEVAETEAGKILRKAHSRTSCDGLLSTSAIPGTSFAVIG